MDVAIEGDRIARVEPTGGEVAEAVRVVSGEGKTLIPGLIEMHTHLGLPAWGSRQGKVWLAYGITSLRTPADALYRVVEERESIRAAARGPRIFYAAQFDGDRIYYGGGLALNDGEELEQEMKRALALEYDLVKTYVRLPDPLQKDAIEKAHAAGVFVTSHEVYPAVAYGVDGIEHLSGTSRRGFSPKLTQLRRTYDDAIELNAAPASSHRRFIRADTRRAARAGMTKSASRHSFLRSCRRDSEAALARGTLPRRGKWWLRCSPPSMRSTSAAER
jgi:hypothetical protein